MNMPLLKIEMEHPYDRSQTVTIEFPGLTAFYNRQEGTPVSRICAVIFGDFAGFVRRFVGISDDIVDVVALYVALEIFEDSKLFADPKRLMRWSSRELVAMIKFKQWQLSQERGNLLGLEGELKRLSPYRIKPK